MSIFLWMIPVISVKRSTLSTHHDAIHLPVSTVTFCIPRNTPWYAGGYKMNAELRLSRRLTLKHGPLNTKHTHRNIQFNITTENKRVWKHFIDYPARWGKAVGGWFTCRRVQSLTLANPTPRDICCIHGQESRTPGSGNLSSWSHWERQQKWRQRIGNDEVWNDQITTKFELLNRYGQNL